MTQGDERANETVIYRVHHATPTLPKTKTVYFFFLLIPRGIRRIFSIRRTEELVCRKSDSYRASRMWRRELI